MLSSKCETVGPERQRELLGAVAALLDRPATTRRLLDIGTDEACLAAAMMLVDPAYRVRVDRLEDGRGAAWLWLPGDTPEGIGQLCATPALALLAARMKLEEQSNG